MPPRSAPSPSSPSAVVGGARLVVVPSLLIAALAVGAPSLTGQCGGPERFETSAGGAPPQSETSERRWWNVWSRQSTENRVLWGMWTTHLNRENDGWQNDKTVAVIYDGYYAASFRTTHGPRGYTLGFERTWGSASAGPLTGMIGFRTGLVYGYDRELGWAAEKYPILPMAQPVLYGRIGPLTTDFTYTWVVLSFTAGVRF